MHFKLKMGVSSNVGGKLIILLLTEKAHLIWSNWIDRSWRLDPKHSTSSNTHSQCKWQKFFLAAETPLDFCYFIGYLMFSYYISITFRKDKIDSKRKKDVMCYKRWQLWDNKHGKYWTFTTWTVFLMYECLFVLLYINNYLQDHVLCSGFCLYIIRIRFLFVVIVAIV